MKISGFTFVRNAIKLDYPIVEAISSLLPLCDEFIVSVGNSEDNTRQLIEQLQSPKIKIIDSIWDDTLRSGGRVLAVETDKALQKISLDSDWAFYIQADEVVHERYLPALKAAMQKHLDNPKVEGLLLNYKHFYGTYDYLGDSRRWYRQEIRIIRPHIGIQSYRDAQGFRLNDRKLTVAHSHADMYHYGWVKHPQLQQEKLRHANRFWHDDQWIDQQFKAEEVFNYEDFDSLDKFTDTHPAVMQDRIKRANWNLEIDLSKKKLTFKEKLLRSLEIITGYRAFEYKNFKLLKE
ncbi:MAG: glycosyltransferase family 2 protein [Cytophagales bacterium]|nr:MAG: glycosyltransferase family 2 protein [Cytophagales bacterium]TAF59272.1 MAG: glycosyltransferase family 2 protein [Cytophagales bacterium]